MPRGAANPRPDYPSILRLVSSFFRSFFTSVLGEFLLPLTVALLFPAMVSEKNGRIRFGAVTRKKRLAKCGEQLHRYIAKEDMAAANAMRGAAQSGARGKTVETPAVLHAMRESGIRRLADQDVYCFQEMQCHESQSRAGALAMVACQRICHGSAFRGLLLSAR